ncbi:hypothetical protein [uncultured Cohaesibacter sp.]|uniref:hypothetical protein n=1 Tax=uncultured Cohaesibacter sp. TaxID=1002546 RepID=UPI0029C8B869|nr:hypothetical protein [uncultured Cohaesibacter sp.]
MIIQLTLCHLVGSGDNGLANGLVDIVEGQIGRSADRLMIPSARMTGFGIVSSPMGKLIRDRAV